MENQVLINRIHTCIRNANHAYIKDYGYEDWGSCGMASVKIYFGRYSKRGIRFMKEELGLDGVPCFYMYEDTYGRYIDLTFYTFAQEMVGFSPLHIQNIDYHEYMNRNLSNVLRDIFDEYGVRYKFVSMESRLD